MLRASHLNKALCASSETEKYSMEKWLMEASEALDEALHAIASG
ncbi:hypothetical protein [Vibrio sp. D54]|nr:hypothetical protein [Vibrio sp. D54]